MKITQAQIEAAAKAIAAVEKNKDAFSISYEAFAVAALTAAAQVGEPTITVHAAEASAYLRDKAHKHEIAATIERCAQVAEKYWMPGSVNQYPHEIAAAIRKLKNDAA